MELAVLVEHVEMQVMLVEQDKGEVMVVAAAAAVEQHEINNHLEVLNLE